MSKALITNSTLTDIADAIRAKGCTSAAMLPSSMPAAIEAIPSGGETWPKPWVGSGSHVWVTVNENESFSFNMSCTIPSGGTPKIEWGDGSETPISSALNTKYNHVFTTGGTYRIDVVGCTNSTIVGFNGYNSSKNTEAGVNDAVRQIECDCLTFAGSSSQMLNFGLCKNLEAIKFTNATSVSNVFTNAPNLKFFIADRATTIGTPFTQWNQYGYGNSLLETFSMPSNAVSLSNLFVGWGCESIEIPKSNAWYGTNLTRMFALKSVTFADGLTLLPNNALSICESLKSCVIPDSVVNTPGEFLRSPLSIEYIDLPSGWAGTTSQWALYNSSSLKTLIVRASTPPTLTSNMNFSSTPNDLKIYVPQGSISAYEAANNWSRFAGKFYELDADGNIPTA